MRLFQRSLTELNNKLLSMLGLCRRAGAMVIGTDLVTKSLPSGRVRLVIYADDSSQNTEKKITDKCSFYGVKCVKVEFQGGEIGQAIGKSGTVCVVGITDSNFSNKLSTLISNEAR